MVKGTTIVTIDFTIRKLGHSFLCRKLCPSFRMVPV